MIQCENGHIKEDDGLECLRCEQYAQEYQESEVQSVYDRGFEAGYAAPLSNELEDLERPDRGSMDDPDNDIEYAYKCGYADGRQQLFEDMQKETR